MASAYIYCLQVGVERFNDTRALAGNKISEEAETIAEIYMKKGLSTVSHLRFILL
jgi:hypothetical protein